MKGQQLIALVDVAGERIPKVLGNLFTDFIENVPFQIVREKIKAYASGKQSLGANRNFQEITSLEFSLFSSSEMCIWLRKEGIDVEAMKVGLIF